MSVYDKNAGKQWTPAEIKLLRSLAAENTPTRVIAMKLGRSPAAIQSKAAELGITLKPANQSPYNRARK